MISDETLAAHVCEELNCIWLRLDIVARRLDMLKRINSAGSVREVMAHIATIEQTVADNES